MNYLILVSHGDFAEGLKKTLGMFAGESLEMVTAFGLNSSESVEDFSKRFENFFKKLPRDSRYIILSDIVGGSPLTCVCKVLDNENKIDDSIVLGGMNLPMVLKAFLVKDNDDLFVLKKNILNEAREGIRDLSINMNQIDESDI